MSAPQASHARAHAGSLSHHVTAADIPATNTNISPVPSIPSREPSLTRGRALTSSSARGSSSRSHTPATAVPKLPTAIENSSLDRRPSLNYGHHRQTSIVHGVQHSRNTSFVNSPATSPLNTHVLASIGNANPYSPESYIMEQDEMNNMPTAMGAQAATNGTGKHSQAPSLHDATYIDPTRRMERVHSGRSRKDLHGRSLSRHHPQEIKTVGEYALHHLFNSFVAQADQKLNACITEPHEAEPRVELICGPGVDANFDQLISALGHIARQKPKPLIDTLMFWRKAKSEAAATARAALNESRVPLSTNGLPTRRGTDSQQSIDAQLQKQVVPNHMQTMLLQQNVAHAERRSIVSIYLLCRVLIEIFAQTTLANVGQDVAAKVEDVIYTQLKQFDPDHLEESPLRQANWLVFGQLLGVMSQISFETVSSRFLSDLEAMQQHLGVKGLAGGEIEGRAVLIIRGMRSLKLKIEPEKAWEASCDFMFRLAKLAVEVHGQSVKYAYCGLFNELLLPIAAKATSQVNTPKWRSIVELLRPWIISMLAKPKHWQTAFPVMVVLLCASPTESFNAQWMQLTLPLQPRLKERSTRAMALRGICRLVWTYVFRSPDSQATSAKKLNDIIHLVFQPGKRSFLSTESSIAEPLIQMIRIIGYKHQDICFRQILFPLMNSEQLLVGPPKSEQLEPERMVIGIRAFLAIMGDLENGEQPSLPTSFDNDPSVESFGVSSIPISPKPIVHPSSKLLTLNEGRLSRPVLVSGFSESTKESYNMFCKILGNVTIACDNAFGGQAVLDEKFSLQTPKTPMAEAFSFARRDEQYTGDPRQGFYDLLHVAVQALPRCLSPFISFNSLINLLCTGTAHVQSGIAVSSAQSLKSIARQGHAQQVTLGFHRFIFNFDDRYATISDGGMLGPGHIENTLRLYVELLGIWIEEIKEKIKKAHVDLMDEGANGRGAQLDLNALWAHVDEIESHGLFFLCSPSRRVRSYAVTVLRIITEFDKALGNVKESKRIIQIMEGSSQEVVNINEEKLSLAERTRLQRGMRKSNTQSTLVELCSSDSPYDSTLWFKVFPNLVRLSFEVCPFAVTLTRDIVCNRLAQMHRTIGSLAEGQKMPPTVPYDSMNRMTTGRLATTPPEVVVEQWKLYLIFACTTLTNIGSQPGQPPGQQHMRQTSKSPQQGDKIASAGDLFTRVIPFLGAPHTGTRDAIVTGLGSINVNLYRTLLESMQLAVGSCREDAKIRVATHQRTVSSPHRPRRTDTLRTEITHVYKLTSRFVQDPIVYNDEWALSNLADYAKELRLFLSDVEIQNEWEFQKLRTHFCGLVEELFEGINKTVDPLRWMPFQARKATFALMEEWCGYSPNQDQIKAREHTMRQSILEREQDFGNKNIVTAAIEIEKRDLRTAALSAMASLCGGPVSITTTSTTLQFDVMRMLSWIDAIFDTVSDRTHAIGRRALTNLIVHNKEHGFLLDRAIEMCYMAKTPKALASYFEVVTQVLADRERFAPPFWKILSAGIYTLGNENSQLRMKSARLIRMLEARTQKNSSNLQDLDISISDKTIAVYKLAQFETSRRLAKQHSELAFHVFSEFSRYFKELHPDHQRNMVAAMLPWVQTINLQVDPNGDPTGQSYMLLVNLFEITVRCGNALHNEIQALWQALATGPHAGNVQLVLDFMIRLCLDKREQNFIDYAKQIVVHISSTPAGTKIVEFLLQHITPKEMVPNPEKAELFATPPEAHALPYLADLNLVLPIGGNKQGGYSLGQICLVLLVDLMVSPFQLPKEQIPRLLQAILVLWDAHIPLFQDQAREMLVHMIHEIVLSNADNDAINADRASIENFIEMVRRHDAKVIWRYDDYNGKKGEEGGLRVPETMVYVANEVVKVFSHVYPGVREQWGKLTLHWATSCSVRHLACRSFQLYRTILCTLDPQMLADMLIRLSNTISGEEPGVQTFSMEILTTLKTIIETLTPEDLLEYPQLFWTACACLETVHEREFLESLGMLEKLLDKLDLADRSTLDLLAECYPPKWDGNFEGLQELVFKGVRSSVCMEKSLRVLNRLVVLPSHELIGDGSRLIFTLLANIPRFMHSFDIDSPDPNVYHTADVLAKLADAQGYEDVALALSALTQRRYRADKDFLMQIILAIRASFFPDHEFNSLVFLMSLLTNKIAWFKVKTMRVLCVLIPDIDMRKQEISSKGPDLIAPLLRLLQTEFCPQALDVLDNVMSMTATPMDKHHLRMSMAGSHSTRATRKEYEKTQSLYGIPEESGWSIPMPGIHRQNTQNNVHAVFYTCASSDAETPLADPGSSAIVLLGEDGGAYFPEYRTATMMSDDTRGDGHVAELVMQLDSLDDFFDDDQEAGPSEASTLVPPSPAMNRFESMDSNSPLTSSGAHESIYDQQTFPILHKSLTRNASISSFQTGFTDSKYGTYRDPVVMTPTAFAATVQPPHIHHASTSAASQQVRPGLHARSITSPAVNPRLSPGQEISMAAAGASDDIDESFSDDDYPGVVTRSSTALGMGSERPFDSMLPKIKEGTRSGFRAGVRRLTGGGGDVKETQRQREGIRAVLGQKSPRVPKVPDVYLQNPKSSDL
ncbi:hypothetical protein P152DRAFT_97645 [Eremomyces bilateralis CBS 781.70]|uniref:Cell morphogenesis protein n=1 Tax=Eremomyces bilateralis CBS 781.70 TaxID=1392243 RepID=A0A6G1FXI5_9PEZI|nr:uncharacterized protein P152DRAFT_97645 [Eremomyces bilateralis CBS 781.70]KAF1810422.1 hypothetical protein P152DRAFT_97645 [Eremomyces bilateralis CBS 781.70]